MFVADAGFCPPEQVEAAAKQLREMCGRPRSCTAAECVAAIEALDKEIAAQVVQRANCNGKAPLHFAAQNRQGGDCVLVCEALIRRGAVVDATTDRGHTPLIYAAGRGRDDAVSLLLNHGANPRVICVTGHTAAQMGVGHVYDDCIEQLEAAEQSSQREWLDFRNDPTAVNAHARHCKSCPSCRLLAAAPLSAATSRLAEDEVSSIVKVAMEEVMQLTEAIARLTASISQKGYSDGSASHILSVSQALVQGQTTVERLEESRTGKLRTTRHVQKKTKAPQQIFKICLAPLPPGAPQRLEMPRRPEEQCLAHVGPSLPSCALRSAIQAALFSDHDSSETASDGATAALTRLMTVVGACSQKNLGQALKSNGTRDRRVIRPLLAEVLSVLKTVQGQSLLQRATVQSLVAAAEPHFAAEILMLRSKATRGKSIETAWPDDEDRLAEQGLWQTLVAEFSPASNYGADYTNGTLQAPEVVWLSGKQVHKRAGGLVVAMLLRLLRVASSMHQGDAAGNSERRQAQLEEVCRIALNGGGARRLDLLLTAADAEDLLPPDVVKDLYVQIARLSSFIPVPPASKPSWLIEPSVHGQLRVRGGSGVGNGRALSAEGELEQYRVDADRVAWIGCDDSSASALRSLLDTLKELSADLVVSGDGDSAARLVIGIDTEWGEQADKLDADNRGVSAAAPAIMQLAVRDTPHSGLGYVPEPQPEMTTMRDLPAAFVIDCSKPNLELRQLTRWLLGIPDSPTAEPNDRSNSCADAPVLIGFAFNHDVARLFTLSGLDAPPATGAGAAIPTVIDLQSVAMKLAVGLQAGDGDGRAASAMMLSSGGKRITSWSTPGLGLVCATFLRQQLDKAEQCSDWDRRPLSGSQIAYAAADAAVLLDLAEAMQLSVPKRYNHSKA